MQVNCILTGVGGQGTVLAAQLIAGAAMRRGIPVRTAETIGMAQRGGHVVSHVRLGGAHSPLVPRASADLLIGFEPAEAVRCYPYLKQGGAVVVASGEVKPVSASLGGLDYTAADMIAFLTGHAGSVYVVDGAAVCKEAGSPKALNVALLGAACETGLLGLSLQDIQSAFEERLRPALHEMNRRALFAGAWAVR